MTYRALAFFMFVLVALNACGRPATRYGSIDNPTAITQSCSVDGREYAVGESFMIDCNSCVCNIFTDGSVGAACTLLGCSSY